MRRISGSKLKLSEAPPASNPSSQAIAATASSFAGDPSRLGGIYYHLLDPKPIWQNKTT